MLTSEKDKSYLWDITQACEDILNFISNIDLAEFERNKLIRFAVERQILVIGEAANHLSDNFITNNPQVPWRKIIALRNIIAHEYGEILVERIWLTATIHIPELLSNINLIVEV